MSTPYRRYRPPTSIASAPPIQSLIAPAPAPPPSPPEAEKKRKRERTHDEIAERKAKKLKKKGIDPATLPPTSTTTLPTANLVEKPNVSSSDQPNPSATGDFAHINSAKKRHRLEKEARKARKALEKSGGGDHTIQVVHGEEELNVGHGVLAEQGAELAGEASHDDSHVVPSGEDVAGDAGLTPPPDAETRHYDTLPDRSTALDTASLSRRTKRHHKLEHVFKDEIDDTEGNGQHENGADEHLRNHASVLSKFQKSAKRSSPSESRPVEEAEEESRSWAKTVVTNLSLPEVEDVGVTESSNDVALPNWFAKPDIVPSDQTATWASTGLDPLVTDRLRNLTYTEPLPVQQSVIPELMPPLIPGSKYLSKACEPRLPDLVISAPTGSGKTISYLLPIIEGLRQTPNPGKLSALIIVPTRELATQVAAIAEALSKGSNIKVRTSTGNTSFSEEQEKLIKVEQIYDPDGYRLLKEEIEFFHTRYQEGTVEIEKWKKMAAEDNPKARKRRQDFAGDRLPLFAPTYKITADILIATPGRIDDHIWDTLGFNLVHVRWLVIDEADKLLVGVDALKIKTVVKEVARPRTEEEQSWRERALRKSNMWTEWRERWVRKVVLSATMTQDPSDLAIMNLKRPRRIVVRGSEADNGGEVARSSGDKDARNVEQPTTGYELPPGLVEYCIPVGDGSEKPLVVTELLRSRILTKSEAAGHRLPLSDDTDAVDTDSDSDSSHQSDVDDRESDEDSDDSLSETSEVSLAPTVLVFTASSEKAARLSHLLKELKPEWARLVTTLVKSNPGRARIIAKDTEPAIVVTTDRAARGLDSIGKRSITHVLQYDVPRSVETYVHRVGRTARAGRSGEAWTLYTHQEGRWFSKEITKATSIERTCSVETVKVFNQDKLLQNRYQETLASMNKEVFGGKG